jgi:hypothetical protein
MSGLELSPTAMFAVTGNKTSLVLAQVQGHHLGCLCPANRFIRSHTGNLSALSYHVFKTFSAWQGHRLRSQTWDSSLNLNKFFMGVI